MRALLILAALAVLVSGMLGCSTAGHAVGRDLNYMGDDTVRVFGLDQPSALHPRDLTACDASEPYRAYP